MMIDGRAVAQIISVLLGTCIHGSENRLRTLVVSVSGLQVKSRQYCSSLVSRAKHWTRRQGYSTPSYRVSHKSRFYSYTIILLVIVCATYCGMAPLAPRVGEQVPDFELMDLSDTLHRLSDYRGKVVVVNFWATWCPPCRDELPSLKRLHRALSSKGLEILAVSVDEKVEDVRWMQREFDLDFTILRDNGYRVSRAWRTFKYPETYIIDREGRLHAFEEGPRDWAAPAFIRDFVKLLNEETPSMKTESPTSGP